MNEKSNKLISLLVTLDRSERRQCRKLILSPFFNTNADLVKYFDEICRREEKDKSLDKRQIWAAVHGKSKAFNDVRFRKFTSDLFKLVKEYILQRALQEEPKLQSYLLLSALEQYESDKLIKGVERNWSAFAELGSTVSEEDYLYRHLLEQRKKVLLNYERRPYDRANIEEISDNLDVYYLTTKLKLIVDAISRRHSESAGYDIHLRDEIIDYLGRDERYLHTTSVALAYYMYRMYTTPAEDHAPYYSYKELMMRAVSDLSAKESYELIQPALNYCRRRIIEGKQKFLTEYLDIYKFALPRELLFEDGVLDPLQFKNTVLTALRSGDIMWAAHYIDKYQHKLPDAQRENAVTYNLATLYFYQKDYDKAQEYLIKVEYENATYNLNAKTMLLAVYYEVGADNLLDPHMDNLVAYLNRHKEISPQFADLYRKLVHYVRRLSRLLPGDRKAIQQLKEDLAAEPRIASRPWLEEKIRAFEG